ncbi:hypothetical protein PRUPE_1G309500 [Prunus persica]|uniref:Uncharacterized protein n=1 Tax=Prunus persica TaxID=3760 RepID=A0A251R5S1_PRUPE|nr:hypothetical protein PRUPE_1G309500 [Prunus persica]
MKNLPCIGIMKTKIPQIKEKLRKGNIVVGLTIPKGNNQIVGEVCWRFTLSVPGCLRGQWMRVYVVDDRS